VETDPEVVEPDPVDVVAELTARVERLEQWAAGYGMPLRGHPAPTRRPAAERPSHQGLTRW